MNPARSFGPALASGTWHDFWIYIVVTMGCGDACPLHPRQALHRLASLTPKSRPLEEVRATRDDIAQRVAALVDELDQA